MTSTHRFVKALIHPLVAELIQQLCMSVRQRIVLSRCRGERALHVILAGENFFVLLDPSREITLMLEDNFRYRMLWMNARCNHFPLRSNNELATKCISP